MSKKIFALLWRSLAAIAFPAKAQQPSESYADRISVADRRSQHSRASVEGFRQGLRDRLYRGEKHRHRVSLLRGKDGSYPKLVAELVRLKVDVLVVLSSTSDPRGQESNQDDSHRHSDS